MSYLYFIVFISYRIYIFVYIVQL